MEPSNLALFWAAVLACSILLYVFLDGFDLGVGVLFGTTRSEAHRVRMMDTIAPFWDGNETWLVVIGAGLFAAFPDVYAVFLSAFYFPVLLLLFGLIFRGIAFEFRFRTERMRAVWDWGFFLGSTVVAFVQGAAIGAMMRGIPVANGQYAGGPFGWLHPFAILTGLGLVLGYARSAPVGSCSRARANCVPGLTVASGGLPPACLRSCSWRSRRRLTTASWPKAIWTRGPGRSYSPRWERWPWPGSRRGQAGGATDCRSR